jgi:hypothetical protein
LVGFGFQALIGNAEAIQSLVADLFFFAASLVLAIGFIKMLIVAAKS